MKTFFFLSSFLAFQATAGTVCVETLGSLPVALEFTLTSHTGETKTQLFELIPGSRLCPKFSSSLSSLSLRGLIPAGNCEETLDPRRDYRLEIYDHACEIRLGK